MPQKLNLQENSVSPIGVLPFREFSQESLYSLTLQTTSRGNQIKYKTQDGAYYVKLRYSRGGPLWEDHLVEVVASQYAGLCTLPEGVSVVSQGPCRVGEKHASYSVAFDCGGDSFLPYSRVMSDSLNNGSCAHYSKEDLLRVIIDDLSEVVQRDATGYFVTMLLLDLVMANEDRHLSNFGLLESPSGQLRFAPLFDFGLGLLEDPDRFYLGIPLDEAVRKVRLKPVKLDVLQTYNFLTKYYPSEVSQLLPRRVNLTDFTLPSLRSEDYFTLINERLGVKVGR